MFLKFLSLVFLLHSLTLADEIKRSSSNHPSVHMRPSLTDPNHRNISNQDATLHLSATGPIPIDSGLMMKAPTMQATGRGRIVNVIVYQEKFTTLSQGADCQEEEASDSIEKCHGKIWPNRKNAETNDKSYCCFHYELMNCVKNAFKKYCNSTKAAELNDPSTDRGKDFQREINKWEFCRSLKPFWACNNGLGIVLGSVAGVIALIIVIIAVAYFIRRQRSGSYSGSTKNKDENISQYRPVIPSRVLPVMKPLNE
ncbi:uncharacterized protein LOC141855967 [Brevipalpus obovatus]|uniref:uncharacterized protein LOC141855967 n=1 Tax=Brevipalpus obovatus TaxID=246614 RepID=UPI003D9F5B27